MGTDDLAAETYPNPTNAASQLAFVNLGIFGNDVRLIWIGGFEPWQYQECSPSLSFPQWTAIYTNTPPTSITNSVVHTGAAAGTNLCYRINAHR